MAPKKTVKKPAKRAPRKTAQKYYRNLRHIPVSLRLQESERRIELAPRGQRNDHAPIAKGDQDDAIFIGNKGLIFEVISAEEAREIEEKQATNIQKPGRHPSLDQIRNQRGEVYPDDAVGINKNVEEVQGVPVAPLDEEGNLIIDRNIGIRRANVPGAEGRNDLPNVPDSIAPEDQAAYLTEQATKGEQ